MSEELGFFTKEQEKALAEVIDSAIEAKGFVEMMDGFVARIAISVIDNELIEKRLVKAHELSDVFVEDIRILSNQVLNKEYIAAAETGALIVNELVDIPGLSEDDETMIFVGFLTMIVGAITKKAKESSLP